MRPSSTIPPVLCPVAARTTPNSATTNRPAALPTTAPPNFHFSDPFFSRRQILPYESDSEKHHTCGYGSRHLPRGGSCSRGSARRLSPRHGRSRSLRLSQQRCRKFRRSAVHARRQDMSAPQCRWSLNRELRPRFGQGTGDGDGREPHPQQQHRPHREFHPLPARRENPRGHGHRANLPPLHFGALLYI